MVSVTSIYDRNFGKHGSAKRSTFFWVAHSYNIGIAADYASCISNRFSFGCTGLFCSEKPSVCPPRLSMADSKKAGFSYWVHKNKVASFLPSATCAYISGAAAIRSAKSRTAIVSSSLKSVGSIRCLTAIPLYQIFFALCADRINWIS